MVGQFLILKAVVHLLLGTHQAPSPALSAKREYDFLKVIQ
jgi:hypothetical protein